ncbi:PfkB family carbohydrate kinase [Methyloterricola oryzae]|uniref:PfkB family carbohydrate kinase n=1 Tax=Methyloterricola oryzae TaxID=1495050 RepID=UPI0005EBBDC1|nr:PfkB family carbohydrate kinase [Methyloterricola oryzae]
MEISDTASVEILVFGEVLADQFPDGDRIGGAPLNVARHLQAFGARPRLLSRIGRDELGERLLRLLRGWGMETAGIQTDDRHPTGRVQVHMAAGGHRFEILPDQAYDHIEAALTLDHAQSPHLIYFGTLAQRSAGSRQALQALLGGTGGKRFLDLNLRPPWFDRDIIERSLETADLLKLNGEELAVVADLLELPKAAAREQATRLIAGYDLEAILVTEGAEGAWMLDAAGALTRTETASNNAAPVAGDTVGAGDAFSAVFILGLIRDWPPERTLRRAHAFAGAICNIRGAVPLDESFYLPFLNDWEYTPAT